MATTPVVVVPHPTSFLQHMGHFFKRALGLTIEAAQIAEPIVDIAFPEIAGIYNSAVNLAVGAEAMAPTVPGTGPQKLAALSSFLVPQVLAWAKQNGVVWPESEITKWASAVVDTMKLIPPPTVAPVPPTSAP
jgi:hypothetical protein